MILMVHDNDGSPKWWAKETRFGRSLAMWGEIRNGRLQSTMAESSASWLDKQKKGYILVCDGIPKRTVQAMYGDYSDIDADAVSGLAEVFTNCQRLGNAPAVVTMAAAAKAAAKGVMKVNPQYAAVWDARAHDLSGPMDAPEPAPVEKPVTIKEMLKDLGKHLVATPAQAGSQQAEAAQATPWSF